VDALIDRAGLALNEDERRVLYGQIQQRVAEDAPYVSLWAKTNLAVAQSDSQRDHTLPDCGLFISARVHR
jgi:ABC-type transport system substrate-binding protein